MNGSYPWDSALEQEGLRQFHMQKITGILLQHPLYSDAHNSANGLPDSKLLHTQIWSFLPNCNLESSWNYKPSCKPFYSPNPNIQTSVGPIEFSELSGVSWQSFSQLMWLTIPPVGMMEKINLHLDVKRPQPLQPQTTEMIK